MKKLNAKGFAHQIAIMAIVVVVAIGGIGSYIYLNQSSAATAAPSACGKNYNSSFASDTKTYGRLAVFGSKTKRSSDSKNLCFMFMSRGSASGVSKYMKLTVGSKSDSGNYRSYAGPIYSKWNKTMGAKAKMVYKGKTYNFSIGWKN